MTALPEILKGGEIARLIPVIADSRKEQRVASVFLATLSAVPSFAQSLLSSLGQRLGQRSVIDTFTEVVLTGDEKGKDRPDGFIQISTGKNVWSALLEAKIGNADLNPDQVQRYLQLARDRNVDAVITVSNQFVARPEHNPVNAPKILTKHVSLYHWSWKFILTEAMLQQSQGLVKDTDQAFILREFIRFLSHQSIGVAGFDEMPAEWREMNSLIKSGGQIRRTSSQTEAVVDAWHQEMRDLALRMSRHLATSCELKLSRSYARDPERRLKGDCTELATKKCLNAEFSIPNAASILSVNVDLKAQTIRVGMQVDAPQDKQTAIARINWLLRQLKHVEENKFFVRIIWPSRAQDMVCPLDDIRKDAKSALRGIHMVPRAFGVFLIRDDGRRFAGRRTFIEEIEYAVPKFYDQIGQHLNQWRPKPPQPVKEKTNGELRAKQAASKEPTPLPVTPAPALELNPPFIPGNEHTDLLEIPDFLVRFGRS